MLCENKKWNIILTEPRTYFTTLFTKQMWKNIRKSRVSMKPTWTFITDIFAIKYKQHAIKHASSETMCTSYVSLAATFTTKLFYLSVHVPLLKSIQTRSNSKHLQDRKAERAASRLPRGSIVIALYRTKAILFLLNFTI